MAITEIVAGAPSQTVGVDPATTPALPATPTTADLLVIHDVVVAQANGAVANIPGTPAGWTQKTTFVATMALGGQTRHTWFYRPWVSGLTAPTITLVGATGTQHRSIMVRARGAKLTGDPTDVLAAQSTPAGSATVMGPITGLTTTAAGGAVLLGCVRENDLTDGSTIGAPGTPFATLDSWGAAAGENMAGALASALTNAGAVTARSFSISAPAADRTIGQMWALLPEPTGVVATIASPVDATVSALAVTAQKTYDLAAVDVSVLAQTLSPAKISGIAAPVDVTVSPLSPAVMATSPPYVEIVVTPYALPRAAHVAGIGQSEIVVEPNAVAAGRIFDLAPVDITTSVHIASALIGQQPVDIEVQVMPLTFGFSSGDGPARRGLIALPRRQPTRVIAQEILSKKWLHWDLQVHNLAITHTLSGAQVITGEFPVEVKQYRDLNLEPWGTWIHVEEDGFIRASGILQPASIDQGEALSFEAVGVSAYPHGIPYLGEYSRIAVDPAQVTRDIWAHMQSFPDAKLGVEVVGTTPARLGTARVEGDNESGPYELQWWNATDCGSEINALAQETPFDYVERSEWNATKTEVKHFIDIGFPRIGGRRTNLVLRQEENLLQAVGPEEVDGLYASQVLLLGAGEGRDKIKGYAGRVLDNRVRRVKLVDDQTVKSIGRAMSLSQSELERAQALTDVTEVTIKARHINAPLGSFIVGDELRVEANVPWAGMIKQWERVLSYTYSPDSEAIRLSLRRAESFTYGGGAS